MRNMNTVIRQIMAKINATALNRQRFLPVKKKQKNNSGASKELE